jgi:hypothetical protein
VRVRLPAYVTHMATATARVRATVGSRVLNGVRLSSRLKAATSTT